MMAHQLSILFSEVCQHPKTKLGCHLGISVWIALFYYGPQHGSFAAPRPAPTLAMDNLVPFQPGWAWVYQSVFILHTLAIWLPGEATAVRSYVFRLGAAFALAAPIFWFYPTLSPRPALGDSFVYRWLITAVDGTGNAFPSLHAAMGLMASLALGAHIIQTGASRLWLVFLSGYYVALLYSTLTTRQHRVLDLMAGIILAITILAAGKIQIKQP